MLMFPLHRNNPQTRAIITHNAPNAQLTHFWHNPPRVLPTLRLLTLRKHPLASRRFLATGNIEAEVLEQEYVLAFVVPGLIRVYDSEATIGDADYREARELVGLGRRVKAWKICRGRTVSGVSQE